MDIKIKVLDPAGFNTPALIVFLYENDQPVLKDRPELADFEPIIAPRLRNKDFQPKPQATRMLFSDSSAGPERIILVGLGEREKADLVVLRRAAAKGVREARSVGASSAVVLLPPGDQEHNAEAAALGAILGLYRYSELKTRKEDDETDLASLTIVPLADKINAALKKAVTIGEITGRAVNRARDLINRPANMVYPETLAEEAAGLAKENGLEINVMDEEEAKRKGMGAFLAVAQGSPRSGRVIVLQYHGATARTKLIALIGKAMTFDSGGLCIKPPDSMLTMKTDMSGGAAVLAVMAAAAQMKLKVNLVGVIPAAENMPSGTAYRPGDVLKSMSGQTIEVVNTDAEGRLILADGLSLAAEFKPKAMIDLATLTGACVVALGEKMAGLMSTDDDLAAALLEAGTSCGDPLWRLPLFEPYEEQIKSEVADVKHTGGRPGGSITAALFLKRFTHDIPWAHLDIAGPARSDKDQLDTPVGATGFGVQLLLKYLRNV
jgi:leucyl aminopeptidase